MMKENYDKLILDALLDKGIIDDELYEKCSKNTVSLIEKNHDYFSRIRGEIRAITDSKEEYRALRDDILGGYDNYRKSKGRDYILRASVTDEKGQFIRPISPSDKVHHNDDGITVWHQFSKGCVRDFSKKQTCFDDGVGNLKAMDNQRIKYSWTLGKDGLMIIKYNLDIPHNEFPQNKEGYNIVNGNILKAEDSSYWEINSNFYTANKSELNSLTAQFGKNKISYDELREKETQLYYNYVKNNMDDCIGTLNKNLVEQNVVNQRTGEPLFDINYVRNGK